MKYEKKRDKSRDKLEKKIINKTKKKREIDIDLDKTPTNYFRLLKEMEKENNKKKLLHDLKDEQNNNKKQKTNINELIYNKYSKNLSNYYNKNQENLVPYGSSKYDVLPMNELIKEMGTYKERVINNLINNENSQEKIKKSKLGKIISNYVNCNDKVTLTPLAQNDKNFNEMEILEKKKFDEAERTGVVMRRIEYTTVLKKKADFDKNEENKEIISELEKAVNVIKKFWRRIKRKKMIKKKLNERIGKIQIQYISNKDNSLKEILTKYDELKKINEKLKEENNMKEIMNSKFDELNDSYNILKEKYEKNIEEIKRIKKEKEKIIKEKKDKEEKINNLENNNSLLKDKISNLDDEFKIFKRKTTLTETETENKLKSIKRNYDKEKNDMNKSMIELQNEIKEKMKEIDENKIKMKEHEEKNEKIKKEKKELNKINKEKEKKINKLEEDNKIKDNYINDLEKEKNENENKIKELEQQKINNDDEIYSLKKIKEDNENIINK